MQSKVESKIAFKRNLKSPLPAREVVEFLKAHGDHDSSDLS